MRKEVVACRAFRNLTEVNDVRELSNRRFPMLKWALIFAVVAIVAGLLGFGGIAGAAAGIAKFLAVLALIIFLVFLVLGFTAAKKIT